ncbi:hypothetical protein GCM10010495_04130 [Kitasatospora herbaricolor]|uniref:hypothetical protein n=1 Tax=Kitasatospora herbaricolor TaxID=68217 RepID=UPI00174E7682|nr:hypothetical protein [Kitasatospora herbaricolor]MDQ0311885.1 hypothetical protein [Kitasatospora herbaricolor]GGU97016.1 hypothetical protein GCM10010495_04130 [Kitasatospora herbaricolor]
MTTKQQSYALEDIAFFEAVKAAFDQHPGAGGRYALASLTLENAMGVDLARKSGFSRVEDGRIITEFVDRDAPVLRSTSHRTCRKWDFNGDCLDWWEPVI